jgi:hypothetical protein
MPSAMPGGGVKEYRAPTNAAFAFELDPEALMLSAVVEPVTLAVAITAETENGASGRSSPSRRGVCTSESAPSTAKKSEMTALV